MWHQETRNIPISVILYGAKHISIYYISDICYLSNYYYYYHMHLVTLHKS